MKLINTPLKPCPFCNGDAILDEYSDDGDEPYKFVMCKICFSCSPASDTYEAPIKNWNMRTNETK